jgi:hypothetical protein
MLAPQALSPRQAAQLQLLARAQLQQLQQLQQLHWQQPAPAPASPPAPAYGPCLVLAAQQQHINNLLGAQRCVEWVRPICSGGASTMLSCGTHCARVSLRAASPAPACREEAQQLMQELLKAQKDWHDELVACGVLVGLPALQPQPTTPPTVSTCGCCAGGCPLLCCWRAPEARCMPRTRALRVCSAATAVMSVAAAAPGPDVAGV